MIDPPVGGYGRTRYLEQLRQRKAQAEAAAGDDSALRSAVDAAKPSSWRTAVPRHTFNFVTGVGGCAYLLYTWCTPLMRAACFAVLCTTVVFHGAHVLGEAAWADRVFMKVDVGAVACGTAALVWSTTGAVRWNCVSATAALLLLWLPTFGPLKGIPYNPIQSVVHVGGVFIHLFAQEQVCGPG